MAMRSYGGMDVGVLGEAEILARLRDISFQQPQRSAAALEAEAEIELGEMLSRVPVAEGTLQSTGRVHDAEIEVGGVSVAISFDTPYAVAQHEKFFHHDHGGQMRYMSSVLDESRQFLGQRLARRLIK
jgi:hypothetical protein